METNRTFNMSRLAEVLKTLLGLNNNKQEEKLVLQPDYVKK